MKKGIEIYITLVIIIIVSMISNIIYAKDSKGIQIGTNGGKGNKSGTGSGRCRC